MNVERLNGGGRDVEKLYLAMSTDARSVSLINFEHAFLPTELDGLCAQRFRADIAARGVDFSRLAEGDRLILGEAELEISGEKKRCFADCPLVKRGERCELPKMAAFARVTRAGEVRRGDSITFLKGN